MLDLSEIGLISILTNFFIVTLGFISFLDGVTYFKKKERKVLFIVFTILFVLSIMVAVITGFLSFEIYALVLSFIYLVTLIIGQKLKKTVFIFWGVVILLILTLLGSFISYLVSGEEGKIIATLKVEKKNEQEKEIVLNYKKEEKKFNIKGEMVGFEAFQMVLKPYMSIIFGKKRMILTSVFSEVFKENYQKGETSYYPVNDGLFDKKTLWVDLEQKAVLLPGIKSVQRVMVSVYPEDKVIYQLKMTNQGLILTKP